MLGDAAGVTGDVVMVSAAGATGDVVVIGAEDLRMISIILIMLE